MQRQTRSSPDSTQPVTIDLDQITQFNPALIYGFDAEAAHSISDPDSIEYGCHGVDQHRDMYAAYHYAEHVILPTIQKQGLKNLSPEQFLTWINDIHRRIARTLMNDLGSPSGEYTNQYVIRWTHDAMIQDYIVLYLSKRLPANIDLIRLAQELDINPQLARQFLNLLEDIRDHRTIEIPDYQKQVIDWDNQCLEGLLTINKLATLYHAKQLSDEEKKIISYFVRICLPPPEMKTSMQQFAEKIVFAWQHCDENNIEEVTKLAFNTFIGISGIHPYVNGNGRTATCMMNIMLVSLGMPSILIRNPNERDDPNSMYSIAIKNIDAKPFLLQQHILQRLQEGLQDGPYRDEQLKISVLLRLRVFDLLKKLHADFPTFDANRYFKSFLLRAAEEISSSRVMNQDEITMATLMFADTVVRKKYDELQHQHLTTSVTQLSLSSPKYSSQTKASIVTKLESLIGKKRLPSNMNQDSLSSEKQEGIKCYNNNGLTVLINLCDKEAALKIKDALNTTQALHAELKYNKETKMHVVYLDKIQPQLFLKIESLPALVQKNNVTPQ